MGNCIRFLTAGESHGKCLCAIIEGIPFGYKLDIDFINSELSERQKGYGRGNRMNIEKDRIKILSGVRYGITTASPVSFIIENNDYPNWESIMSAVPIDFELLDEAEKQKIEEKIITRPRPAHADFAAYQKYAFSDLRYSLERSSARETATRVAVGAICQSILKNYDISFSSQVLSIGGKSENFEKTIDEAKEMGDTLGGVIEIIVKNPPSGLGSFVHWERRIDSKLAGALMSIPAVKSVEIGLGKDYADALGSKVHDEIIYENGKYMHKTNNSGGIEGGITNGEDIVLRIAMKPIPTMRKPLKSVTIKTHELAEAHFERSDTCAVASCAVVARNMSAIVILDCFLEKFSSDTKDEIDASFKRYLMRCNEL